MEDTLEKVGKAEERGRQAMEELKARWQVISLNCRDSQSPKLMQQWRRVPDYGGRSPDEFPG
jgi:hypothetical protein